MAILIAVLTGTTLKEPERKSIGENSQSSRKKVSLFKVLTQPRIIMLAIAASIRHSGGMTFAYNADLYYSIYFPDVDLGWWLFAVTIGIGKISKQNNTSLDIISWKACCPQKSAYASNSNQESSAIQVSVINIHFHLALQSIIKLTPYD